MDLSCHNIPIDWDAVEEARQMPAGRKAELGGELFAGVCERMREGIRQQFPGGSEVQWTQELLRRLELARALETRL